MKRLLAAALSTIVLISCCIAPASASERRASLFLSKYEVTCSTGSAPGTIEIDFDVSASALASRVGVYSIDIYKSNGNYITTIYGSTSKVIIRTNTPKARDTYVYPCTPGMSYYAEVTIFAENSSGSDSRTVTTNVAAAR